MVKTLDEYMLLPEDEQIEQVKNAVASEFFNDAERAVVLAVVEIAGQARAEIHRLRNIMNGTADEVAGLRSALAKRTDERQTLARELSRVQGLADDARAELANHCCCTHDGHGNLTSECEEHREIRDDLAREVAHHADTVASLQKVNAALQSTQADLEQAQRSWRCFQCGMVLTTEHEARNHFGEKACVSLQHERERQALKQRVEQAEADLASARRELEESWAELRQVQLTHAKELADAQAEALAMRRERDSEIRGRVEAEANLAAANSAAVKCRGWARKAERERDESAVACDQARAELRAMLAEVKDWLAVLEGPEDDIHVLTHGEMLAKVTAILRDQPQDSGYRLMSIDTIAHLRAVLVDPENGDSDDLIREIDALEGR